MTTVLALGDQGQVAEARRAATQLAERLGFGVTETGRVAIVATELATNLVKHARGGSILLSAHLSGEEAEVEMIAVDRGPGIADTAAALRDGHSTAGSAGQGLGAIRRQSDLFDMVSWPGAGTAVLARIGRGRPRGANRSARWGIIATPYVGEDLCGDGAAVHVDDDRVHVLVADGLGHGAGAARASGEALRIFAEHRGEPPGRMIERLHLGLRATRGAAVAVARLDARTGEFVFCGLGNIAGGLFSGDGARRLVSQNGTAGVALHRIQEAVQRVGREDVIILHSDGIATSWSLERYPGLIRAHPALVAAVLWRDHNRGRDDATVLVLGAPQP